MLNVSLGLWVWGWSGTEIGAASLKFHSIVFSFSNLLWRLEAELKMLCVPVNLAISLWSLRQCPVGNCPIKWKWPANPFQASTHMPKKYREREREKREASGIRDRESAAPRAVHNIHRKPRVAIKVDQARSTRRCWGGPRSMQLEAFCRLFALGQPLAMALISFRQTKSDSLQYMGFSALIPLLHPSFTPKKAMPFE